MWFSKCLTYFSSSCAKLTRSSTDVFDGMMVVLATYTLNALHPVRLLKAAAAERWSTSVPLAFKDQSSV